MIHGNYSRKVTGNSVDSSNLYDIAKAVSKECGGLSVALVTVGRALRNKQPSSWSEATWQLRNSKPVDIRGMDEKVFSCRALITSVLKQPDFVSYVVVSFLKIITLSLKHY